MKTPEKVPKENAGKDFLSTPPLKTHVNCLLALLSFSLSLPSAQLLETAIQHGVNTFLKSDQNLEALAAPFTFLGLQVNMIMVGSGETGSTLSVSLSMFPSGTKCCSNLAKSSVTRIHGS